MNQALPSNRLKRAKRALRREILARRDALALHDRATRSRVIAERLLALPELRRAGTVLAFWSFGSEVDTGPILDRLGSAGVRIALPRLEHGEIAAVAYRRGDPTTETSFGAREPAEGVTLNATDIDVVVTPGVAFDRRGFRVGYGGGFYDRFFRLVRGDAFRVAIGFAFQVVDEVPHGRVDVPIDAIVTDQETIRCAMEPAAGDPEITSS